MLKTHLFHALADVAVLSPDLDLLGCTQDSAAVPMTQQDIAYHNDDNRDDNDDDDDDDDYDDDDNGNISDAAAVDAAAAAAFPTDAAPIPGPDANGQAFGFATPDGMDGAPDAEMVVFPMAAEPLADSGKFVEASKH